MIDISWNWIYLRIKYTQFRFFESIKFLKFLKKFQTHGVIAKFFFFLHKFIH